MGKPAPRRRSGNQHKAQQQQHKATAGDAAADVVVTVDANATPATTGQLPPCVKVLRESTQYADLEDACSDIAHFARQARHNANFLVEGVPQRLTQLLVFTSPYAPAPTDTATAAPPAATAGQDDVPHNGILYVQIAAAEALRSLVVNSEQDCVVDALTSAGVVDPASGATFAEGLATLVTADWARIVAARRRMTPADWMSVYHEEGEDQGEGGAASEKANPEESSENNNGASAAAAAERRRPAGNKVNTRNSYFTLLRHLEEVLALVAVCAEASESCAAAFSEPASLCLLLEVLRVATTTTWETLLHPTAQYYADETAPTNDAAQQQQQQQPSLPAATVSETVLAMRVYKRREACLLASLAVCASDVLLLLSPDSPTLAQVLTGGTPSAAGVQSSPSSSGSMTAEQRSFLNTAVDAADLRAWLADKPTAEAQLQEHFSDAVLPSFVGPRHTVIGIERERVLYDLLRTTLSVQGTLLHVAPGAANLQRVLPLLCDTLAKVSLPIHVWCGLLPLLMDTCEAADEEVRTAASVLATHRLRSTQYAVRLLHIVVNAVGEQNDERLSATQDDEAAFAANPLASLLQSGNLFFSFGLLLKDVLWISSSTPGDVMAQQAQQRALRAEAESNTTATEVQMVLLSTEVNVWEVASTLLLMLPVASLGDAALTWRALMQAVQHRYELHLDAAAATAAEEGNGFESQPVSHTHANIIQHSASAQQLLWMQLESLVQMLWTVQRKQSKAHGGVLAAVNDVQATAADVDVLVRVAWESTASAPLKQACVGTVGLLCASMQSAEAAATAARFALAVVANGGPAATFGKPLTDAYTSLVAGTVPTYPAERRVWLQQLALVDAAATVRSEAANTLVDLFLDERYDAAVYWPLSVHDGLRAFKQQLGGFLKRRLQLDKETKRKFHLSTETPDAEQWGEVLENLDGFLDYKASNKR